MADVNGSPTAELPRTGKTGPRLVTGIVTADKTDKTRKVVVSRVVRHPQYGKYVKHRTVCYVHDETNESRLGDTVEIRESRPLSRTKRWALVRVTVKAPTRTVANLEGAVAGSQLPPEVTGAGTSPSLATTVETTPAN